MSHDRDETHAASRPVQPGPAAARTPQPMPRHDTVDPDALADYDNLFRDPPAAAGGRGTAGSRATHATIPHAGMVATAPPPLRTSTAPPRRRRRSRRLRWILLLILAYVVALAAVFAFGVGKIDALPSNGAADTAGANYLLVGTDNRENLTKRQRKALHTGFEVGQRTDTIMLLHVPLIGQPSLISLPRDSWVPIEGYGSDKINAAYSFGGPPLLVDTVETVTGVHVDHYVEIGMDGVADVVDSLGGVTLCPKDRYNDERSGLNVKAGCQEMDGKTALAYVRMRYSDPRGDIGRAERQREYIAAVGKKAMSPLTWLNPFKMFSVDRAASGSLTVDQDTGLADDLRLAVALGMVSLGWGESTSVPVQEGSYWVGGQEAVKWDTPKALELFESIS